MRGDFLCLGANGVVALEFDLGPELSKQTSCRPDVCNQGNVGQ